LSAAPVRPRAAFVFPSASHVLEHVPDPGVALERWVDLLVPGGYLIISVPHRDLYEKRKVLPSLWNQDHKSFWMPDAHEPPVTRGLRQTIREALGDRVTVLDLRVVNSGYVDTGPAKHAEGEFSIEAVLLRRGT
jgi:SAM-dependent methyltransferase